MFYYDSFGYCTLLEYNVIYFVWQLNLANPNFWYASDMNTYNL